jgi:hypothetical protein
MKYKPNNQGAAAILTAVIVGAAALIIAFSASILGLGELDLGYTSGQGGEAFAIADGCMEEALRQIRLDTSYAGTGSALSLGDGTCIIGVTSSGSTRQVSVTSTLGSYHSVLEVGLTLSGNVITVDSWEESTN